MKTCCRQLDWQLSQRATLYFKGYFHDWDTHYTRYYNRSTSPDVIDVLDQDAFWGYKDYGANALLKLSLQGCAQLPANGFATECDADRRPRRWSASDTYRFGTH